MLDFSLTRPSEGQKIVEVSESKAKLNMRRAGGHTPFARRFILCGTATLCNFFRMESQ